MSMEMLSCKYVKRHSHLNRDVFRIRKYFYSSGSSRCYSKTDLSLSFSEFSEEIHLSGPSL